MRVYCSPHAIQPARHILFRNDGNLTFTDVTEAAGVARSDGRGLGVVAADLNGDGRIDLYVANDMCPNFVYLNRGDGTFADATESSGAGYGPNGAMRAGMGVDAEDVDGDGWPDCFVANGHVDDNLHLISRVFNSYDEPALASKRIERWQETLDRPHGGQ